MKKILSTLVVASFCLLTPMVWAELALTPETVAKMQKVINAFNEIEEKNPGLNKDNEDNKSSIMTVEGRKKIVDDLNASPLKNEALKVLKANGFESPEVFFDLFGRVAAASIALTIEANSGGDSGKGMEEYIASLKLQQQGASPEIMASIQESLELAKEMTVAAKAAKPEDIAALKKYPEILQLLESE